MAETKLSMPAGILVPTQTPMAFLPKPKLSTYVVYGYTDYNYVCVCMNMPV